MDTVSEDFLHRRDSVLGIALFYFPLVWTSSILIHSKIWNNRRASKPPQGRFEIEQLSQSNKPSKEVRVITRGDMNSNLCAKK